MNTHRRVPWLLIRRDLGISRMIWGRNGLWAENVWDVSWERLGYELRTIGIRAENVWAVSWEHLGCELRTTGLWAEIIWILSCERLDLWAENVWVMRATSGLWAAKDWVMSREGLGYELRRSGLSAEHVWLRTPQLELLPKCLLSVFWNFGIWSEMDSYLFFL